MTSIDSTTTDRTVAVARLHGIGDLRVERRPAPVTGPGTSLVREAIRERRLGDVRAMPCNDVWSTQ